MNYLQIALLALIQGTAELLPVSSTAHVILAEKLMGIDPSSPEWTFMLVMLHTGTMFAVIVYFWPSWRRFLFAGPVPAAGAMAANSRAQFLKMVILATACTGVLGYALKLGIERLVFMKLMGHEKGEVEALFKHLPLIAASLFAVGIFMIVAGSLKVRDETNVLKPWPSALIGIVQGLCLPFRGFSRSGATISTGLLSGISRQVAEEFSFALAVVLTPAVIVLETHRLLKGKEWKHGHELVGLLLPGGVGMLFSFVAGLAALRFLSWMLTMGQWKYFGFYCIGMSAVVLTAALLGY